MMRTLGVILTIAFLAGSVAGTAGGGWILGETVHPARAGTVIGPFTLGMLLAALAIMVEGLRLAVSACGERIWRRSRFQGIAFGAPLWLACTGYCTFMPLLALALVPLLPTGSHMLTVIAPAWAAIQIATGLLPGIPWSAQIQPAAVEDKAVTEPEPMRVQPSRSEPDQSVPLRPAVPAHLVAASAASADDFFRFLSRLSELPAGSTLPRRGRIGSNHEIHISQASLAALVGRSKPTIRRWLQELERAARIVKRPRGRDTCILLSQYAQIPNGQAAHLNGAANDAA
jgi:hypothetical protein